MKLLGAMVLYLVLIVGAFAAIYGLGWAAVYLVGPPMFRLLPTPLAYLATAIATAALVYGALFQGPKLARSTWNKLTAKDLARGY